MRKTLITNNEPKSPISECFRALRTNIQFKNSDKKLRTILVTSTMQSEGKSTVTSNLAVAFAQAGKRTLIIDADMRKTKLHKIFEVDQYPGFANYLLGLDENGNTEDLEINSYIKPTIVKNLSILTAGTIPPNPSELLALNKVQYMIDVLKRSYDIIIFDSTPCMLVTDAIILSRIVDTTLILASYNGTKMENLKKIKRDIENVGGNIGGVILNKFPMSQHKYKYSYYYGEKEKNTSAEISNEIMSIYENNDLEYLNDVVAQEQITLNKNEILEVAKPEYGYPQIESGIRDKIRLLEQKILELELRPAGNNEESKILGIATDIRTKMKALEEKMVEIELKPTENPLESKMLEIANSMTEQVKALEEKMVEIELKPTESPLESKMLEIANSMTEQVKALEEKMIEIELKPTQNPLESKMLEIANSMTEQVKALEEKMVEIELKPTESPLESKMLEIANSMTEQVKALEEKMVEIELKPTENPLESKMLEIANSMTEQVKALEEKMVEIELKPTENPLESKMLEIANSMTEQVKALEEKMVEIELKPTENPLESKMLEIANSMAEKVKGLEEKIVEIELKPSESPMELKMLEVMNSITDKIKKLEGQIFEVEINKTENQESEKALKTINNLSNEMKKLEENLFDKIEILESKLENMGLEYSGSINKNSNIIAMSDVVKSKNNSESIWWTKPEKKVKLYEIEVEIGENATKIIREINDSMVVYEKKVQ